MDPQPGQIRLEIAGIVFFPKVCYFSCGSPPGVMMADTLSFNAKIGVVDF